MSALIVDSLKGGSIPILTPSRVKEEPSIALIARRCETAKPLGMFRSTESEFLLCYDSTLDDHECRSGLMINTQRSVSTWTGELLSLTFGIADLPDTVNPTATAR